MFTEENRNTPQLPQKLRDIIAARLSAKTAYQMRDASAAIPGQVWALESPIMLLDTCTGEEVMPVVFIQDYIADEDIGNNKEVFYAFMVLPQSAEPVLETPLEKWQHYPFVESYDLGDVPCDPAVGCVSILHP
jgi:hypothetical protein